MTPEQITHITFFMKLAFSLMVAFVTVGVGVLVNKFVGFVRKNIKKKRYEK
jgi:hypothetical protein